MQLIYRFYLTVLILLISICGMAQPRCKVKIFGTEDGLPASVISGFAQSTDNLVWIASWNGLACYDGYRFTNFRSIPGKDSFLPTNHLTYVAQGKNGNLWTKDYDNNVYLFDTHTCNYICVTDLVKKRYGDKMSLRKALTIGNGTTWIFCDGDSHIRVSGDDIEEEDAMQIFTLKGFLYKVVSDSKNNEWLFTQDGCYILTSGASKAFMLKGTEGWGIEYLTELNNRAWVASPQGKFGYIYIQGNHLDTNAHFIEVGDYGHITRMLTVNDRTLALATDNGVILYDVITGKSTSVSTLHPSSPTTKVTEMYIDSKKRLWCFTPNEGVIMVDAQSVISGKAPVVEWFNTSTEDRMNSLQSDPSLFHEDMHHTVWLVPRGGCFSFFNENTHMLEVQNVASVRGNGVYFSHIKRYFSDNQGNLWLLGYHNLALINFRYSNIHNISRKDNRETRALLSCNDGSILMGSIDGVLSKARLNGNNSTREWIQEDAGINANYKKIYALYRDTKGRLWMATKGNGLIMQDENGEIHQYVHDDADKYSISGDEVYDVVEDTHGRIVVATYDSGINIIDETMRFINAGNDLKTYDKKYNKVRRVECTADGVVLVSTTLGLLTFSDSFESYGGIRFFSTQHSKKDKEVTGLYSNDVMQTCSTVDGHVYVATLGGGLQEVVSSNLLQDNLELRGIDCPEIPNVIGLVVDNQNDLWVIGESRMAKLSESGMELFDADDLDNVNITEARPAHDPVTDRITIGTEGGAITFIPQEIKRSRFSPTIVFTALRFLDGHDFQPLLNREKVEVDVDHRSFVLYFSALDYAGSSTIRYAYCLDDTLKGKNLKGLNKSESSWIYTPEGKNVALFNNFPPGNHVLYVRSTNADGIWMNNVREIRIYAEPTFFESWWGRLIIALLVVVTGVYAFRKYIRRKKVEIQEEALEQADAGKVRFLLKQPEIVDEDKMFMENLLAYIEEHIGNAELKIDDIAQGLNLGRSAFYTKVKQMVDMSPNDFLRHVRMQRAEDLVKMSQIPFSQIAYKVGFTDPKYFSKCFRKHTGMSPSEYRTVNGEETSISDEDHGEV